MLSLLLILALAPQSLAPNCGLELRLIADERVWTPGGNELVLVEIENPNPFPVVLPSSGSVEQSVRFRLRSDRGEFFPRTAGTSCAMIPTAWRTVGLVLPPQSAMHLAYGSDVLTEDAWRDLPVRGELLVRLEFDAWLVERALSNQPPGTAVASGAFEAVLACSVEPTPDRCGRTNPELAFRQAARDFLQSVTRRARALGKLKFFRAAVADGQLHANRSERIQELEALDLEIDPAEVQDFADRFPTHPLVDDVWFSFARESLRSIRVEHAGAR